MVDLLRNLCCKVGIRDALMMDSDGVQKLILSSVTLSFAFTSQNQKTSIRTMPNEVVVSSNKAYVSYILKCVLTLLTGAML
jgi:hypothetical protein